MIIPTSVEVVTITMYRYTSIGGDRFNCEGISIIEGSGISIEEDRLLLSLSSSPQAELPTWLSVLFDVVFVLLARILMIAQPLAEGSGIPEMKCELGGASHLLG